jgi:type III secretion protein F
MSDVNLASKPHLWGLLPWPGKGVYMTADFGNIGGFLNTTMSGITDKSDALQKRMDQMTANKDGISQQDLLSLQFEMGQYNAMIESVSNVTKSLTDTLKSLAQKAG